MRGGCCCARHLRSNRCLVPPGLHYQYVSTVEHLPSATFTLSCDALLLLALACASGTFFWVG
jgi:hypothetical protein